MKEKIVNLLVARDDGIVRSYYGIVTKNTLWLVTAWLVNRNTQEATPERMIRVDSYQKGDLGGAFDFVNIQLPKAVIEGRDQDTPGFVVRSLPDSPKINRRDLRPLPRIFP